MNPKFNLNHRATRQGEADTNSPTVGEITDNMERMLKEFSDAKGQPEVEECYVGDVLTDLLHYCDRRGFDGLALLHEAEARWIEERDPRLED